MVLIVMRKSDRMVRGVDITINVLRQKVYELLIEQLQDKFKESEYADKYSVKYSITTDRIQNELIEEDEGHYYDSIEAEEGAANLINRNFSNNLLSLNPNEYNPTNHIEQSIMDIYENAYLDMDEYGMIVNIIQFELGRLMILPIVNSDTFKSELNNRLSIFERLNQEGLIRDKIEINAYIKKIKNIDLESEHVVKVSKKKLKILEYRFHDLKSNDFSIELSCQVSYGNPDLKLIQFSLAILLILISYDIIFIIDKQGTQRQSENDTQIMSFARLVDLLVNSPIVKLRHRETINVLNNIISSISGKTENPFLLEKVIKLKEGIIRDDIKMNDLTNVTDYFRPTDMFGFSGLVAKEKTGSINSKTKFVLGLLKDTYIHDSNYFINSPLNYLERYIRRRD